jgi:secondary thiamine-phosphate synthase enzyme
MKKISLSTSRRTELAPIGRKVRAAVAEMGLNDGAVTVFVPHTTAGVTINEGADPDVAADLERVFDRLVPWDGDYAHAEGNTAAHAKASLVGSSARVLVAGGQLQLGTWQEIFFCEFDGPRRREVWVSAG